METQQLVKLLTDAMVEYQERNEIDDDKLWDLSITKGTNKRVKRVGGTYNHLKKLITINIDVIRNSRDGELSIKLVNNIIRHELAHHIDYIIRGTSSHDKHFKSICKELNMIDCNGATPYHSDIFEDDLSSI